MGNEKITTTIKCQNIAPIEHLEKEIKSNSLKIAIFASNGSGKTFISRLFRLTENTSELSSSAGRESPTDTLLSFEKSRGFFSFNITTGDGTIKENFTLNINKGEIPEIPKTNYLYHTFNQDYVEQNIRALSYEKNSDVEGFILGKINIDLKDDEDNLKKIEKEEQDLNAQIESDIVLYLDQNVNNIQNIKRLGEYKILEVANIFQGLGKDKYQVPKTFEELLHDYNKIKSVPENLEDIQLIENLNFDLSLLTVIKENLTKEYTLSSLSTEFKKKIKGKQIFVEKGMQLFEVNNSACPFCEQHLDSVALQLIDDYTKYLADAEAKTIKQFRDSTEILEKCIQSAKNIENANNKCIVKFDEYKKKYIPSSEGIELQIIDTESLRGDLQLLITLIERKIQDISKIVPFENIINDNITKYLTLIKKTVDSNNNAIEGINSKKNKIDEENKLIRKEICKSVYNLLLEKHEINIKNVNRLREQWKKLNNEIKKKKEQQKVSKRSKVASTIKSVLNYFFSNKYTLDKESFRLVFNKNILEKDQAKNVLSEGEKNIVAFAYYIGDVHLKIESEDDYDNLFFIIDDPISSMDFSHVYTLCGVIRDIGKVIDKLKRERLIIFTHNNDFMRVLASNNIIDKKLLLKKGELKDFNHNLTVPYINHLIDIYNVSKKREIANHTTANSIRHVIETLSKFQNIEISSDSIAEYIKRNIPNDTKSYTLINDLSHGGWRSEQAPINDDEYVEVCETIINHIEKTFSGQIEYCKKLCD